MADLHRKEEFRTWLEKHRGLSRRVAGDVISRCGRAERMTGTELSKAVRQRAAYLRLMEELDKAIVKAVQEPRGRHRVAATLRYSLRLYAQFLAGGRKPQYSEPRQFRSIWA
jgi:hypothetical protein